LNGGINQSNAMTERLHQLAESDTPAAVTVPQSWQGIVFWAVGRFGSGILLAAACGWALMRVYEDHAKGTDRLMTILEQRAKVDADMTSALLQLRGALDEVAREARNAHRYNQP
jgi:hypothetical protein